MEYNKVNCHIKTKRGNTASGIITKAMSRRQIGARKMVIDQQNKQPTVSIVSYPEPNVKVEKTFTNKDVSATLRQLAYSFKRPLAFCVKPVTITHYVLSDIGKQRLEKRKKLTKN